MKKYFYISMLFIFIQVKATDFESLVRLTLENSLILKKSSLETSIAEKQISLVKSSFYPSLRLEANIERSKKFNDKTTPSSVGDDSLTQSSHYQSSASMALSYDLFRFGGSRYELESKRAGFEAKKYEECEGKKEIVLKLLNAYAQARINQLEKEYKNKINKNYIKIYNFSKRLNKSGLISKSKEIEYAKKIADNILYIQQIDEALQKEIDEIAFISGIEKSKLNNLKPLYDENSFTYIETFEQSQTYKKLMNQIHQKEAELKLANTRHFPSLSLYGKYDFYGQDKDSFINSAKNTRKNGYRIGLGFSWVIFDGFKTKYAKDISFLELEVAKTNLEIAREQFNKDLVSLQTQNQIQQSMFLQANESKNISENIHDINNKLYKSGQMDKINTLQTQIQTLQADLENLKIQENLNKTYQMQKIKYAKAYICKVL